MDDNAIYRCDDIQVSRHPQELLDPPERTGATKGMQIPQRRSKKAILGKTIRTTGYNVLTTANTTDIRNGSL